MCSKLILCGSIVLVLFVLHVQSTDMMGGGQGPIIVRSSDRRHFNDMFMIGGQTKCGNGPIVMRSSTRRGKQNDMMMLGGDQCKKSSKKVEVIPMPYKVKEAVYVPYKETVHVPVHIPVHIPVPVKEEMSYGGSGQMGGYGGDMGGGQGGYSGGYRRRR